MTALQVLQGGPSAPSELRRKAQEAARTRDQQRRLGRLRLLELLEPPLRLDAQLHVRVLARLDLRLEVGLCRTRRGGQRERKVVREGRAGRVDPPVACLTATPVTAHRWLFARIAHDAFANAARSFSPRGRWERPILPRAAIRQACSIPIPHFPSRPTLATAGDAQMRLRPAHLARAPPTRHGPKKTPREGAGRANAGLPAGS